MSDQQPAPASPATPQTPQQQQTRMWNGRLERCKHCSPVYASLLDYRHANRFTDITVLLPKGHPQLQTIADSLGNFEDIVKARDDGRVAVRAHKLVLAIASGTLSHYFENVIDEAAEGDVVELDLDKVLPADPQHVAGAVLDWMYARQVHVHAGNVLGMLRAAEDLDVQDLLQLAKTILARFLAVDPALVLPSAVQFARHDLVDTIVRALLQPPPPSPSQSNRAPRITDPRTWPAVAHLPVPQFTALLDQTVSVLTPSDQFRLARSYVDTNMPCAHRVCLMHPDLTDLGDRAIMARQAAEAIAAAVKRPDDDAGDEHTEDDHELNAPLARAQLCTCYLATPLTNDQVAAIFGRVEFRALDADLLTEAFHAPHVPKELVFYALMAKLASLQQPAPAPVSAPAPAPAQAPAPAAAPAPAPAPSASLQPSDAAAGVTQDQLHDMIASTLSRVKAAEEAAPRPAATNDTAPAAEGGAAPALQQQQAPPQPPQPPQPQPIPSPPATPAPQSAPTPAPTQAPLAAPPTNPAAVEESVSPIAKTLPPPIPVSAPPNAHHAHGAPVPVGLPPQQQQQPVPVPSPQPVPYGAPLPVAHPHGAPVPVPTVDTPAQAMAIPPRSVAGVRPRGASAAPPSARSSMYSDTSSPAAPMLPQPQGQLRPVSYAGPAPQMQPRAVAYPARPPPANGGQYGGGPHVAQLMGAVGGDRHSHEGSHASFDSSNGGNKRSSGIGKAFGKIFG
ncbi:hypothetical protein AMAG_11130 [Allomyces macrogynus ATCC 38327]|uniref:BTB domain-containing protein n=1 Tax=Allomyces macrogynus (strain ATCC 38327) TaxID=578462 RepID=A0A0L0SSN4_ALLM3|nr:hypothetical protein AMAG_11130 [Allomyces macrogynus ATCC 38327]|eukprot:KNE65512.1 hypothetical protein AMAG_11130 [Allomyces macrogynus ATCC 38327]